MKSGYEAVKNDTINFAARFGFVTQSIFFKYLCVRQKTQQYLYWRDLIRNGVIFQSKTLKDVCYLTKVGRRQAPRPAVPSRLIYFVEHDAMVAEFYLELVKSGLVEESWTAYELSIEPWKSCSLLGCADLIKIPDLVVDLKSKNGTFRVAFEMERSRKSGERYNQMALSYWGFKRVNLLLVNCVNEATRQAIERAFNTPLHRDADKKPALFLANDFCTKKMDAPASFDGVTLPLKKLLLAAVEMDTWGSGNTPENRRNSFRQNLNDKKESA